MPAVISTSLHSSPAPVSLAKSNRCSLDPGVAACGRRAVPRAGRSSLHRYHSRAHVDRRQRSHGKYRVRLAPSATQKTAARASSQKKVLRPGPGYRIFLQLQCRRIPRPPLSPACAEAQARTSWLIYTFVAGKKKDGAGPVSPGLRRRCAPCRLGCRRGRGMRPVNRVHSRQDRADDRPGRDGAAVARAWNSAEPLGLISLRSPTTMARFSSRANQLGAMRKGARYGFGQVWRAQGWLCCSPNRGCVSVVSWSERAFVSAFCPRRCSLPNDICYTLSLPCGGRSLEMPGT